MLSQRSLGYVLLAALTLLAACATSDGGGKEQTGTAIGAGIGGVIGAAVGGNNRVPAALLGAVLGGVIGNRIGASLDERDREALAAKTMQALNQNRAGETVVWQSDHSGASAEITPMPVTTKVKEVEVKLLEASGTRYATAKLNLRSGPGVSFGVVGTVALGTEVILHGVTSDGWYRIQSSGMPMGYASGQYLSKTNVSAEGISHSDASTKHEVSGETAKTRGNTTEEVRVVARVSCRNVTIKTKVDGKVTEETAEACQAPDGSWGA